ncbi:MAG: beta strand repeat-containing protein, partial [Elusimicrobiota bacterium]
MISRKVLCLFSRIAAAVLVGATLLLSPIKSWAAGLTISSGTVTIANNATLTSSGDITINGGNLVANASQIIVQGTWTLTSGSFSAGTSTVTLSSPGINKLVGPTTFYVLEAITAGSTVQFTAGATFYVTNTLRLQDVDLRSTSNGSTWYLRMTGSNQSITSVDVRDSNASLGTTIQAPNSTNSGNNTNWNFPVIDIGTRYWVSTITGNWNSTSNWSLASGGASGASVPLSTHTVVFDGIGGSNGTCNINTTINIATLTISGYSGTLNTLGYSITVSSAMSQSSGTIELGTTTLTLQGNFSRTAGTFNSSNSTVTFSGNINQSLITGGASFNHIQINKSANTVTLGSHLNLNGSLTLTAGTLNTNAANNYSIAVGSDVVINGGTFVMNASTMSVALDWLYQSGTFTPGTSTVTFTGVELDTLTGPTTFYSLNALTAGTTLQFTPGTTIYVTNTLALSNIKLQSTSLGATWYFSFSGTNQNISNVQVQDSNALGGNVLITTGSTNLGNNLNWAFGDDRYWVASGAANWSATSSWSRASGGTGGASVPTSTHTVIFDGVNGKNGTCNINLNASVSTLTISGYSGTINTLGSTVTIANTFTQTSGTL